LQQLVVGLAVARRVEAVARDGHPGFVHSDFRFCGPRSGLVAASAGASFSDHHIIDHLTAIYHPFAIHFGYTVDNKWRRNG
jgi:hypothetical protein